MITRFGFAGSAEKTPPVKSRLKIKLMGRIVLIERSVLGGYVRKSSGLLA
jgi:hypothetical protein